MRASKVAMILASHSHEFIIRSPTYARQYFERFSSLVKQATVERVPMGEVTAAAMTTETSSMELANQDEGNHQRVAPISRGPLLRVRQ